MRSEMNGMEPPMPVCTGSTSHAARIASRAVCAPSASTSVAKGMPESTAGVVRLCAVGCVCLDVFGECAVCVFGVVRRVLGGC